MAISFPTGLDGLTNPAATDPLNSPSHSGQHSDANDILEALETKVGINSSAVTSSHDWLIAHRTAALTARGDLLTTSAANTPARLAIGSAGKVLYSDGTDPSWSTLSGAGLAPYDATYLVTSASAGLTSEVVIGTNALNFDTADAGSSKGLLWGSAADVNLYRSAANTLKTDDQLRISHASGLTLDNAAGGVVAQLRPEASILSVVVGAGTPWYWTDTDWLWTSTGGTGTLSGTSNYDGTNWRTILRPGASLSVESVGATRVPLIVSGFTAQSADIQQWRAVPDYGGSTPGTLLVAVAADGKLLFGPAGSQDTNLYRGGANVLKTDDRFEVGAGIWLRAGVGVDLQSGGMNIEDSGATWNGLVDVGRNGSSSTSRIYIRQGGGSAKPIEVPSLWYIDSAGQTYQNGTKAVLDTDHTAASDPHTGYLLESLYDAKGDIITASADNTPSKLTVGADDTILMADASAGGGLKWVASASPSAVGTAAATGTGDTFTRGDHVHAHEAAHLAHDTFWAAKGDLAVGSANDTAVVLGVGADKTVLQVATDTPAWVAPGALASLATDVTWAAKGDLIVATANDAAGVLSIGATAASLRVVAGTAAWVSPSAATPAAVSTSGSTGTAANPPSADDHVHAHEAAHVAHDTVWAAKGDILGGTANDTAAILSVGSNGQVLSADSGETTGLKWIAGGGAPTDVDYLVGTASAGLSAEIVVGTSPGGELGGTWATPTVDATHSGSAHTDFIAKSFVDAKGDILGASADNTPARTAVGTDGYFLKADSGATSGISWVDHTGAADPHTGYVLESLYDAKGDIITASADNTPAKLTVGADDTILMADAAAAGGLKWVASASPSAVGTAAATGTGDTFTRGDHVHAHEAGHVVHDTIWDAKGDLAVGTAADTGAVISIGATSAYARVVAGTLSWVAASAATPTTTGTASAGTAANPPSADDHVHALETHGASKHTDITRSIFIPVTNPDTSTEAAGGTAPDRYPRYNMVDGATSGFGIMFLVPDDWTSGALTFKWYLAGNTSFGATDTVRLQTSFLEVADSALLTGAGTGATTNVDPGTGYVGNDLFIWTDPTTITPSGPGVIVRAFFQRIGANAADDWTGTLLGIGLRVDYTANQ